MLKNKRGQAAGAAVLLAVVTGLIVLFILFLPPTERAKLLGEGPSPAPLEKAEKIPAEKPVKEVLLRETPGHLSYIEEKEIEKLIPSTHIFTKTESRVLAERDYLSVERTVFSAQTEEFFFEIKDLEYTREVLLDFVIESYQGELIILLNQKEIFNRETNKLQPLRLPSSLLAEENTLTFQVSSPTMAFWRTNRYKLKSLKVVADVTETSAQEAKHLFYIKPDEAKNIEGATLRFSLSCLPQKIGRLEVKLNEHPVFEGVPENCEDIFYYTLPPEIVKAGNNWLSFKTKDGDYDISHIAVKIKLEVPSYPVYYFELKEEYFTKTGEEGEQCGEIDGSCPAGCDEDADYDCCSQEYSTSFWCDAPTRNSDDRCVGRVGGEECGRCPAGYEDKSGSPPEACQKLCGDDKDDYCPAHCNTNYDQDCCFEREGSQFWCDNLPTGGVDFACLDSVGYDECVLCPGGYEGEEAGSECPTKEEEEEGEEQFKKEYDVILTLEFADGEKKEAEIYLNGHKISFDTYKVEFSRNIDNYLEPWSNSLKIVPKTSFDLKEITVELKG